MTRREYAIELLGDFQADAAGPQCPQGIADMWEAIEAGVDPEAYLPQDYLDELAVGF